MREELRLSVQLSLLYPLVRYHSQVLQQAI